MAAWVALLGHDFDWGKKDCAAIVRDFYNLEFDMEFEDYARPSDWDADVVDILRTAAKS